ncbi:transcriptional regulator [Acidobacteria bacterium Mor1]|nr:transcriptional regulator [Acidobacteria bacterium Mor1]
MHRDPFDVVALAYDRMHTFEFGIVSELFGLPRPEFDRWYRLRVARVDEGPLRAIGGLEFAAPYSLRILDSAGTIIVPGWRGIDEPVPGPLIRKLRKAHDAGARILSVCSGAFVLAAAGLLDGRRATTHWMYAGELAARYPEVQVDPDVLFVDEGSIVTSAGSAAGIDMALHVIGRDLGAEAATRVARRLVVPPQRDGGQQQFIRRPVPQDADGSRLSRMLDRLRGDLSGKHTVASMARMVHMSPRTFARRFKETTGTTPHLWLQTERVRSAQQMLESTRLSLDAVAAQSGFADAQLLRLHFRRVVGTSPSAYRKSFGDRVHAPGSKG